MKLFIILLIFLSSMVWSIGCDEGDCKDGIGTYTYSNGIYVGEFKFGDRTGQGIYKFFNGDVLEGGWRNNLAHGKGKYLWNDGSSYVGDFQDGEMHGQGSRIYLNGDKFVGTYKNGQRVYGTITFFDDGSFYEGEFKDEKKHGQGRYVWSSGDEYIGEYLNGNAHGQGKFFWNEGDSYIGEYENGKRHGQGTYYFSNLDKYVGEFKNSKLHGKGTYYYASGNIRVGVWDEGSYFGSVEQWEQKIKNDSLAKERYTKIYNACLLDKSRKVDMKILSVRKAIQQKCDEIAKNPSWLDEIRYK